MLFRRNINYEHITLTHSLAVNPNYKDKLKWTFKGSVGEYCLNIINVSSQDEGFYSCFSPGQMISNLQFELSIEGIFHFVQNTNLRFITQSFHLREFYFCCLYLQEGVWF